MLFNVAHMLRLVRSMYCQSSSNSCLFVSMIATGMLGVLAFMGLTYKGWIVPWTGRFYSLWDTGHLQTVSAPDPFGILTCPLHLLVHHPCAQRWQQHPRRC